MTFPSETGESASLVSLDRRVVRRLGVPRWVRCRCGILASRLVSERPVPGKVGTLIMHDCHRLRGDRGHEDRADGKGNLQPTQRAADPIRLRTSLSIAAGRCSMSGSIPHRGSYARLVPTTSRSSNVRMACRARCSRSFTAFGVMPNISAASAVSKSSMSRKIKTVR
jgi:hypothetical protein